MYPLFETIRIVDRVPQHLEWHQSRMEDSFLRYFSRAGAPSLSAVLQVPEEYGSGIVKCRFLYGRTSWTTEFSMYTPRKIETLRLVTGDHLEYSMKYTDRFSLEELLKQKGTCDDVLIVRNGRITDTSYTNIALFNGERWVTPLYPLLAGTCRGRLIHEGVLTEADIKADDLGYCRSFKLINAMLRFEDQAELPVEQIV